eukprot:m.53893 g.53893  ORF g.53893 m.53893 type:complete len:380 (+) comp10886_c0_seq1:132-1271(+)
MALAADADHSMAKSIADGKEAAPAIDDKAALQARNKAALEKRKAALAAKKAAEASAELPEGWRRVESRSRPGEFVYENIHTEERQAWFPEGPAVEEAAPPPVAASEDADTKAELKKKNLAALQKRKAELEKKKEIEKTLPLPEGWTRVESRSRPGEIVYENEITKERQAWFPDGPATAEGMSEEDRQKALLKKKNMEALAKRKAALAQQKTEEATKPLPDGWKRVESRSRPGEFVYENQYTEERQAWFPSGPAEKPLPEGWRKVESRSYPGEFVYENVHTLERQAWVPTDPAPLTENQVKMPAAEQMKKAEAAAPKATVICKVKALYDYTAANREEEIDLLEGDIVMVEYKASNGWWVGSNARTSRSGIFPGTYVEEIP